jgi:hypothetical protein
MTTLIHRSSKRLPTLALLGTLTASMAIAAPQSAQADHPVVVGGFTLGAVAQAALITAAGAVAVALIEAAADDVVAGIGGDSNGGEGGEEAGDGDGGDGGDGGDTGSGGEGGEGSNSDGLSGNRVAATNALEQGCFATMPGGSIQGGGPGTSKFLNINGVPLDMQAYMTRDIDFSLIWNANQQSLAARADYHFDGDVMKSPSQCDYIYNSDTITWDLVVKENPNAQDDFFLFSFEELVLTTTDVPNTFGRSSVVFKVFQGANQIWQWEASARQGFASTHSPVPPFTTVTASPGELLIENFLAPIPVTFAPGNNLANVRVEMTYAGRGMRW